MSKINQIKKNIISDLELSEEEAEIFLALIKEGKTSSTNFKKQFAPDTKRMIINCKKLEQKGMIIEIKENEFQALHPRFAIVNRYRRLCGEKNILFKKNIKIDNLGIMLENYQNKEQHSM
jgi:sugar-specific transcriptional regulator TrmB